MPQRYDIMYVKIYDNIMVYKNFELVIIDDNNISSFYYIIVLWAENPIFVLQM